MVNNAWVNNKLFIGLNQHQLQEIAPFVKESRYPANAIIMQEGDPGTFMLMIEKGSVGILKGELLISEKGPKDLVGLMALIDNTSRSATVISGEEGIKGYEIDKKGFEQIMAGDQNSIVSTMLHNFLKYQQNTIRLANTLTLQEARAKLEVEKIRVLSAKFFVQMVVGLIIFMFLMGYLKEVASKINSTYVSFGVLTVYGIWSIFYVKKSGLPLKTFGLTMDNFMPALKFAAKYTAVFLLFLLIGKWVMTTYFPEIFGKHLIELYSLKGGDSFSLFVIIILYSIHAVIQEFIARGCIQGGLMQFISGKNSALTAIIVATLMFSSFHLVMDMKYALLTLVPGLFWGFLFYKNKNVLAVSISHIVIGVIAIFVLNITR